VAALAWLIIPVLAGIAAAFWGRWASGRQTTGDGASLAGYERFRAAMEGGRGRSGRARRASAAARAATGHGPAPAASGGPAGEPAEAPGTGPAETPGTGPAAAAAGARVNESAGGPAQPPLDDLIAELPRRPRKVAQAGEEDSPRGPVAGPVP
jgi:hypothetical protein